MATIKIENMLLRPVYAGGYNMHNESIQARLIEIRDEIAAIVGDDYRKYARSINPDEDVSSYGLTELGLSEEEFEVLSGRPVGPTGLLGPQFAWDYLLIKYVREHAIDNPRVQELLQDWHREAAKLEKDGIAVDRWVI